MKCLNCDNTSFSEKKVRISTEYSGEPVEVLVPALVCKKCDEQLMNSEQMNTLRQAAADAYRDKNGLMNSQMIVGLRKNMKMSQREFAKYIGVGEASIKRWETYYAQELAMDQHIKLKCDRGYAEDNILSIDEASQVADESRGNKEFSWERFSNAAMILIETCVSPLFINKALFYLDFLHFKNFGTSITGSQYARLEYGPCPENYKVLFKRMLQNKLVVEHKGHELKVTMEPNWDLFDDDEKTTIRRIIKLTQKDHGKKLYNLSHKEEAFEKAPTWGLVSYKFAKKLKVS